MLYKLIPLLDYGETDFVTNYLLFYPIIPFLNLMIENFNEKQHRLLILYCLTIFSVLPFFPQIHLTVPYLFWFLEVYIIGAYIRIYPKQIFLKWRLWCFITLGAIIISVIVAYVKYSMDKSYYFLLVDSNAVNAIIVSVSSFILFANLPLNYNRFINMIAKSTFAVLCISANCNTMIQWLWVSALRCTDFLSSRIAYIHSLMSVLAVFITCVVIDMIRRLFLILWRSILLRRRSKFL